jgi:hypothetical protein
MGLYRDSQLGLCIDLTGPDGNVFYLLGIGNDLAAQLGQKEEWKLAIKAAKLMGGNYMTMLNMFKEFFPIVTLIGYDEIAEAHSYVTHVEENQELVHE